MSKAGIWLPDELVGILNDGCMSDEEAGMLLRAVIRGDSSNLPEKLVWAYKMSKHQMERVTKVFAEKRKTDSERQRQWRKEHKLDD